MKSKLDISSNGINELSELVYLGEVLVEKHLKDGPNSRMELQKIAQVNIPSLLLMIS